MITRYTLTHVSLHLMAPTTWEAARGYCGVYPPYGGQGILSSCSWRRRHVIQLIILGDSNAALTYSTCRDYLRRRVYAAALTCFWTRDNVAIAINYLHHSHCADYASSPYWY